MSGGNQFDVDDLIITFRQSIMPLAKVFIGKNLWVGVHAVVMADISEGTAVTKFFDKNSIIAGVPAKEIRKRGSSE
jgi:acetyltransferase-like isoleucine patch superfamily enzyme